MRGLGLGFKVQGLGLRVVFNLGGGGALRGFLSGAKTLGICFWVKDSRLRV